MQEKKTDNARLLRALLDFQKELLKANNLLCSDSEAIKKSLASINSVFLEIERINEAEPENAKTIRREIDEKKILSFFSALSLSAKDLKKALSDFEEQSIKAEVFLESFRHSREYFFKSEQNAFSFLEKAFSLYSIDSVCFKPEFLGMIDLNDLAQSTGLQKRDKQCVIVPTEKLEKFFSFLRQKNTARNFRLDSEEIQFLVKSPLHFKIEADNAKIKRLDRLAKELDAEMQ